MKRLLWLALALFAALPLSLPVKGALAQSATTSDAPVVYARRVIVEIKADSPTQAMDLARKIVGLKLDEKYGAVSQGNGTYLVRGDLTGVVYDGAAAGHVLRISPDTLSAPN